MLVSTWRPALDSGPWLPGGWSAFCSRLQQV